MLRHGRPADAVRAGQRVHRKLPRSEVVEQPPPQRVSQGREHVRCVFGGSGRHAANDT
jgi:hypothetical protein